MTIHEFKAFIAIIFTLGIVKFHDRLTPFRDPDFGCPFIQKLMSYGQKQKAME